MKKLNTLKKFLIQCSAMEGLSFNIQILCWFGLYTFESDKWFWMKRYNFFILILLFAFFVMTQFSDLFRPHDFYEFTQIIFFISVAVLYVVKLLNFYFYKKLFRSILIDLQISKAYANSSKELQICEKNEQFIYQISFYMFIFGQIIIVTLNVVSITLQKLPVTTYDIGNFGNKDTYIIVHIVFTVCTYYCGITLICLDTSFYGLLISIDGQYEVLSVAIQKLGSQGTDKSDLNMKNYLNHHALLKTIVNKTQKFFKNMIALFFGTCVFSLCLSTFQLSTVTW